MQSQCECASSLAMFVMICLLHWDICECNFDVIKSGLGEKVDEVVGGGVGGVVGSTLGDKIGESMVSKLAECSVEKLAEVL